MVRKDDFFTIIKSKYPKFSSHFYIKLTYILRKFIYFPSNKHYINFKDEQFADLCFLDVGGVYFG